MCSLKKVIFEYVDSNMAGNKWRWEVSLERLGSGSFTLSAEQTFLEADDFDEPFEVSPVSGLVSGEDIYDAFQWLVSEICSDGLEIDLEAVAKIVAAFDTATGRRFLQGEDLLEQRTSCEQQRAQIKTEDRKTRFKSEIEELTADMDDEAVEMGAASILSRKKRAQNYLECRLERFGELPTKEALHSAVLDLNASVDTSSKHGWVIVKYRRTSDVHGQGGICPFCGFEVRIKPLVQRWNTKCRCGASLDFLGKAYTRSE